MLKGLIGLYSDFSPLSNSSFIQYCDSNIGLFSFASIKVIALKGVSDMCIFNLRYRL